jgi:hypothetical protein
MKLAPKPFLAPVTALSTALLFTLLAASPSCGGSDHASSASGGGGHSSGSSSNNGGAGAGDGCGDGALPNDIVDACGKVVPAAYRAMAAHYGTAAGITYRYGEPSTGAPPKATTLWEPPSQAFDPHGNGSPWPWQVGGPQSSPTDQNLGDYSSNQAQVIYAADKQDDPGVTDLQTLVMASNIYSESPVLPWVYYGGGHPDVNIVDYQKTLPKSSFVQPTALGRCPYGWCTESFTAFQGGLIMTAGENTARNHNALQLPANKVPTSISVTPTNEFLLVTVWDTQAIKGQVAVIALAGTCDGCEPGGSNAAKPYNWWGEWGEIYPGLRNYGDIGFMKLLGFVDIPGLLAPTEISAASNYVPSLDDEQGWLCSADGMNCRVQAHDLPLTNETNRQSFVTGANANRYSKSGMAVVVSKSEKKVAFIDLTPLFAKFNAMYFGAPADFAKTQSLGQNADQWPYTFSHDPSFSPKVAKVMSVSEKPTAVNTSIARTGLSWVATEDGKVQVYSLGGYLLDQPAKPADIKEIATVAVGKNPTCIAYAKHDPTRTDLDITHEVIVVSRGDQRIDWIGFDTTTHQGKVVRSLVDSRMVDPLWAEDEDNHGTESYLLKVTSYGTKSVLEYRYGPVIFHTNPGAPGNSVPAACQPPKGCGVGKDGTDLFEFGGSYKLPGGPFRITSANVP